MDPVVMPSHGDPLPRPDAFTITVRALRLRCPRCGEGRLFERFLRMNSRCSHCGLNFNREPGYYLGAVYINYGTTSLVVISSYIIGRFVCGFTAQQLILPLAIFCVTFPLLISRHARALWLALDCRFDTSVLEESSFEEHPR